MDKARFGRMAFWMVLITLSLYYLYRAVHYRFIIPDRIGPSLFDKQIFYVAHLALASPIIFFGPLQFSRRLRSRYPAIHRRLGQIYVDGSIGAALTAIYLGAIGDYQGSRAPIVIGASLWLFFTVGAWRAAVHKRFEVHRQFMIRSYGMALVLVWLRIIGDMPGDTFFFYIDDLDVRDATQEWMSWVLPLLVMEIYLSWWPQIKKRTKPF